MKKQDYQELSVDSKQKIRQLEKWMQGFFCNEYNRTDSIIYALDNGFLCHAIDSMASTGATDKEFNDIYESIENISDISRNEAKQICQYAVITICPECNNHMFADHEIKTCSNCLKGLK